MKNSKGRLLKGLGLTGMLTLCLLLTGCVVPPEDIDTSGNYYVTDNNPPFQSLGPQITNTPYVPPVYTNTPDPTTNVVVTNQPSPTNTVDVSTIGGGSTSSNNQGQSVSVVTPNINVIISAGTATPSSTSATLKNGSTGSEVKKMQQRLKELGYLSGSADGDFGDATETAVKAFQLQNGLQVDGKAGNATLTKLYSSSAKKAPTVTVTNTPKPTATPFTSYKNGDTGSEVKRLQQRLKELGYLTGSADGDFGDATEAAVKAFQRNNSLTADGKAGNATLTKLYSSSAKAAVTPTPEPTSLKKGDTGSAVKEMQQRLRELGYLSSWADGDFGDATEEALNAFQRRNGLTVDGKCGPATLSKLYSDSAKYAVATATPTAKPTNTPKPTATPKAESLTYYLELGTSGTRVRTLQNRLIELGWLEGSADGKYGNATEYAVKAFQARYASLWKDGIAGPDTLTIMYGAGAAKASTPASSLGISLEFGDENDAVKAMQNRLKELEFYNRVADGEFGSATKAAVIAFQTANGLKADGIATTATLDKLYAADAKNASTFEDEENAKQEEEQDPEDATDIEVGGYTTLREGDSGTAVKNLQQALKNQGYYSTVIDGSYGYRTVAAVKTFQQRNGLKADGIAGPATQALLYGTSASGSDTSSSLKQGSSGTEVRNLQYVLYELGYYDGTINGEYDELTAAAVRAFQINNNVSPVDGVAGPKTLKVIYSSDAIGASASSGNYTPLEKGDKGTLVVELQEMLAKLGYLTEVTGSYDSATVEAVKNFQRRNDLTVDGNAGQQTQSVLYGSNPTPAW